MHRSTDRLTRAARGDPPLAQAAGAAGDKPGGAGTSPSPPGAGTQTDGWQRTLLEGISAEEAFNDRLRAAAERLAAQRLE